MSQTFIIAGMTCQHCVARVQSSLAAVEGVSNVEVSLTPPRATIHAHNNQEIDCSALSEALSGTQFSITEMPSAATQPLRR
ncbi:heavy-metal-associated domain-containing protein [Hydromonas duriensis]|uniref:Heavy-metal-associated domain-containing protein n=1 Tax=Hydromonas duriensis TaxID=1527608 RepID=A0A4R6Y5X5_9BURK|nr:heavy metal-associated domain-containing protein [Hydromonas duriensis]TDR30922.1 heavy-metal-associated domain-containing protein [Hydromonas duriensis]